MSSLYPLRSRLAAMWILLSAAVAVFITGNQEVWASAIFFASAGAVMVVCGPASRPGWVPIALGAVFVLSGLLAFLPQAWFPEPAWRSLFPLGGQVPLAESISPQPWLGWYWWLSSAAIFLVGAFLLSNPLSGRGLAVFLHLVSGTVAIYAVLAIFAWQSGWKYPFDFGGVFGFLPNKNHTGTLLYIGAIVSFGLMQWEVVHGHKAAAALAALCGAPPLAGLLFFCNSRAGVICFALGILLWGIGAARGPGGRKILAGAGIMAVFLTLLFLAGGSESRNRLALLWHDAVTVQSEDTGKDVDFRQPIFRDTAKMLTDYPLTGVGLGQFAYVFPQYRKDSARAAVVLHPESSWFMSASESGVFSLAALLGLAAWFLMRCWHARSEEDGMLRWTAASAIGAALIQAFVDVPWHRPALGWFMLTIALASVPSSGLNLRRPVAGRVIAALAGLLVMAGGIFIGWECYHGRVPPPFRWSTYTKMLVEAGQKKNNDEGEVIANEAIRVFPLKHEAYYWLVGYLRMFLETDAEITNATQAGRLVEPVLPRVAVDQALLWKNLNPSREIEAWSEAIKRTVRLDKTASSGISIMTGWMVRDALESLKGQPEAQQLLLAELSNDPILTAYWMRSADAEAAAEWTRGAGDPAAFLDALPEDLRDVVLRRWVTLPDAAGAVRFMEEREAAGGKPVYWRQLSRYYAAQHDLPRAVQTVASALDASLQPATGGGGLQAEMAALVGQGNTVAARRLAKDALTAREADVANLKAAMTYFAAQEDWDSAWRAASRLAMEAKIGH